MWLSLSHHHKDDRQAEKETTQVHHQQPADLTRSMLAVVLFVLEVCAIHDEMTIINGRPSEASEDRTAIARMRKCLRDLRSRPRCPLELVMMIEIYILHHEMRTKTQELGDLLQLIVGLPVEASVSCLVPVITMAMHETKHRVR